MKIKNRNTLKDLLKHMGSVSGLRKIFMLKKFWYLFLVLLIEGSSLMAVEIMGAKFLAPFYGSSLYVWTAVLAITMLGLTLGYYIGGIISAKHASEKLLIYIDNGVALFK